MKAVPIPARPERASLNAGWLLLFTSLPRLFQMLPNAQVQGEAGRATRGWPIPCNLLLGPPQSTEMICISRIVLEVQRILRLGLFLPQEWLNASHHLATQEATRGGALTPRHPATRRDNFRTNQGKCPKVGQ